MVIPVPLGSAIGFRLDSLLKLTDTRARNNKMTLMNYLCKVHYFSLELMLYISYQFCQSNQPKLVLNY